MLKNRIHWNEQEEMMANAYQIMASSFSQISSYMKNHIKSVQNGGGIITNGDIEEIIAQLTNMINKNLHNVSQMRVEFKLKPITQTNTTSTNESYIKNTIRLTESDLNTMIKESVNKILNEGFGSKVVRNPKLTRLLNREGLGDILLCKDYGYFYITSDNEELANKINMLHSNAIYLNSFNQQSPEKWVEDIKYLLKDTE